MYTLFQLAHLLLHIYCVYRVFSRGHAFLKSNIGKKDVADDSLLHPFAPFIRNKNNPNISRQFKKLGSSYVSSIILPYEGTPPEEKATKFESYNPDMVC